MPHKTSPLLQSISTLSYHKPHLGQWLIQQINSGQYPGLCWLDVNHTKFRIPWKHISRKDISENDYKLFKAWAVVSGKYTGLQAEYDPAKWKTNFRCALNSIPRFSKLEDNSMNPSDPHKVYEIGSSPSSSQSGSPNGTSPVEDGPLPGSSNISAYPVVPPILFAGLYDIGRISLEDVIDGERIVFGQHLQNDFPDEGILHYESASRTSHADDPLVHPCNTEDPPCNTPYYGALGHGNSPVQNAYNPNVSSNQTAYEQPDQRMNGFRTERPDRGPWEATPSTVLEAATLPVRPEPSIQHVNYQTVCNLLAQHCYTGLPLQDLEITINYRKTQMLHLEVKGSNIYQLCYKCDTPYGQQIHFPSPETLLDRKQVSATEKILDSIRNGLLIEVGVKGISARRLGKSHVFCLLEDLPREADKTNLLPRDEECLIFSSEKFVSEWKNFMENKIDSPKFEIYLCFGQHLPDLQYKEKKLILVKIVPKFCRYLYEMALREGASSLNDETLSLQISNNSSLFDFIESYLNGEEMA
ncbi:interferon regulatory factor 3-like isoform X1 [Protopterus annectens]|uniref:interferon regulatory factor 3-like isoform X1 n=1 Tax=Protopterus annectens TaxID=7888 RepID=UPI001CF99D68|nr:interferon regulatory factor 3-like isoform X1 [Protopterus annectens]XP_043914905.1 interferon regulatory factor 3-like isoform X1 [Protopterus annectens]